MAQASELKGPDLAAGIELHRLQEGVPLLGHANGEAVMSGVGSRASWRRRGPDERDPPRRDGARRLPFCDEEWV